MNGEMGGESGKERERVRYKTTVWLFGYLSICTEVRTTIVRRNIARDR